MWIRNDWLVCSKYQLFWLVGGLLWWRHSQAEIIRAAAVADRDWFHPHERICSNTHKVMRYKMLNVISLFTEKIQVTVMKILIKTKFHYDVLCRLPSFFHITCLLFVLFKYWKRKPALILIQGCVLLKNVNLSAWKKRNLYLPSND